MLSFPHGDKNTSPENGVFISERYNEKPAPLDTIHPRGKKSQRTSWMFTL